MKALSTVDGQLLREAGLSVIEIEQAALMALSTRINADFEQACCLCLACRGRVIVSGMGKSGHIARKLAATLASTGTPAFFVHPGEASHGDMGMITADDVLLILSNSGRTDEIVTLLPLIQKKRIPLIAMTGSPHSVLAKAAQAHLDVRVAKEACPLGLAPTASTTAALAMGDALAVALLKARHFTADDFALSHPGGALGRRLLLHVSDVMITDEDLPCVGPQTTLTDALVIMTEKRFGLLLICDKHDQLKGIYTDGDLRRTLNTGANLHTLTMGDVMITHYQHIAPTALAVDALSQMQEAKITTLVVMDEGTLAGMVSMHNLLQAGVV